MRNKKRKYYLHHTSRLLELLLKILAIMPRVRLPHSPREKKHMPLEKAANSFIVSNSYTLKTTSRFSHLSKSIYS